MSGATSAGIPAEQGPARQGARLPHLAGLDGLRALAVIAVLVYHAGARWLAGGFLGVEVFFVISGYLITSLLQAEFEQWGRIDFKAFWLRRARRLLPALYLVLATSLTYCVLFLPDEVANLRSDVAAAGVYVTNWYLILANQSYFESIGRPSLLRHLWSLAVEEQFYLLWPLLFALLLKLGRRWRVLAAVLVAAAASAGAMAWLYQPDADPSRVYYGTDTRAAGLLIGAALALVWAPGRVAAMRRPAWPVVDLCGAAALAALVWQNHWFTEYEPWLYRGGFALVAVTTALVIAAAVHPRARVMRRLLGWGPLNWVGTRSYGIYLWHWPVFMLTRPQLDVPFDGPALLVARLLATGLLAEVSYRVVEMPLRTGALGRAWQSLRAARGGRRFALGLQWTAAVSGMLAFAVALGGSVVRAERPGTPAYLSLQAVHIVSAAGVVMSEEYAADPSAGSSSPALPATAPAASQTAAVPGQVAAASPAPSGQPTADASPDQTSTSAVLPMVAAAAQLVSKSTSDIPASPAGRLQPEDDIRPPRPSRPLSSLQSVPTAPAAAAGATAPAVTARPQAHAAQVAAVGDSVMLGAASALQQTIADLDLDAATGRQVYGLIDILRTRRAGGLLGDKVVIHVGNNGTFSASQFDEVMKTLAGVKRVVLVNVKVPRAWEEPNNTVLAEGVKRYPNAVLVDWRTACSSHPEWFWGDGIHLRPEGAKVYAQMIAAAMTAP